ncbi:MAG: Ig-like domain-containing protein, partial [Eubacterium sp.]
GTATIKVKAGDKEATCTVNVKRIGIEKVTIKPENLTMGIGAVTTLTAELTPENTENKQIDWKSSDKSILAFEYWTPGQATALKAGTVEVTAEVDGVIGKTTLTVGEVPVESLNITAEKGDSVPEGETLDLSVKTMPELASKDQLIWTSSNEACAVVTQKGRVIGLKEGTVTIAVTRNGVNATKEITVTKGTLLPITASLNTEKAYPGSEITVSIPDLQLPSVLDGQVIKSLNLIYSSDFENMEMIKSPEAKDDLALMRTLTFTIPENTAPGTYYLYNGRLSCTSFVDQIYSSESFYWGDMPVLTLKVGDKVADAALERAKTEALNTLKDYANTADYREAEQLILAQTIVDGTTAINAATDIDAVNQALSTAKTAIDAIATDAEQTLSENKAAADAVTEKIAALGKITDLNQEAAVKTARSAYDALSVDQKALVSADVLNVLTDAETQIKALKEKPVKPEDPSKPEKPVKPADP